jgi:hypothetical protein
MSVVIDGTLGITTPAETVQGALTTTGNTILGDATTDTLNVGAGGLVKDASGNVGIGTSSPGAKLGVAGDVRILANAGAISHTFIYNENGGEINLHDETGAGATLFDQASNTTRLLELINGSNLQLGLGGANTTGVVQFMGAGYTERMRIDSSGIVTMPYQPAFFAKFNSASAPAAGAVFTAWTVVTNRGGGSFTNGRYTVPVAGAYQISPAMLKSTGALAGGVNLAINGATITRIFYCGITTDYMMGAGNAIVSLNANDFIELKQENSSVGWYGDAGGLGSFTINLLG